MRPSGANGVVGIADPRVVEPRRSRSDQRRPGHGRTGWLQRDRCCGLLGAATGVDPNDAATAGQTGNAFIDYTQFLDDEALDGARIGVWRDVTFADRALTGPVLEPILDSAIDALEAQGATLVEGTDIDSATDDEFERSCASSRPISRRT